MVRTKVFVGNLSFKTREAELATEFGTVAKVLSANIITRGPRSLGYGFVELENVEDAKKAVAAMDKKEIDGRPINCELAKIPVEGEEKAQGTEGASPSNRPPRAPRNRGPRNPAASTDAGAAPATGNAPAGAQGENKPRQPRQPREPREPREPRPPRNNAGNAPAGGAGAAGASADGSSAQPRTRPPRKPRAPRAPRAEGEGAATSSPKQPREPKEPREPREPRAPRPKRDPNAPDTRVPSQTSLFVANLPFALTNEQFGAIFTEANLKFKKAHVVTKRNTKSKGFGFVEFESQEDQQKALTALQGKKVEERELAFKVALEDPKKAETAEKTPQSPAPAQPAAASPAPAAASPAQAKN